MCSVPWLLRGASHRARPGWRGVPGGTPTRPSPPPGVPKPPMIRRTPALHQLRPHGKTPVGFLGGCAPHTACPPPPAPTAGWQGWDKAARARGAQKRGSDSLRPPDPSKKGDPGVQLHHPTRLTRLPQAALPGWSGWGPPRPAAPRPVCSTDPPRLGGCRLPPPPPRRWRWRRCGCPRPG